MQTLAINEKVIIGSESWRESDQNTGGIVIGSHAGDAVIQVVEKSKMSEGVGEGNGILSAEFLPENIEVEMLASEPPQDNGKVINVTKADNGKTIFGGDGFGVYSVQGAMGVKVINGEGTESNGEVTEGQGIGIINVRAGSSNITYNGGAGQDLISLQNDSGNGCLINAGAGNDIISVQAGSEHVLKGGLGNDKYSLESLEAGGNYRIIQSGAGANDRDTLNLTAFCSEDFTVDATYSKAIVLTYSNKARIVIEDWYNSPLMNIAFADARVRVSELAQSKKYSSYDLKLAGSYAFSGNNTVNAEKVTLKNSSSMDKLTVTGNNNMVVVNGGEVRVNSGSYNIIDNSVNKGEVNIYGGDHLSIKGSEGDDYLKIYGGTGILAELGAGKDQVQVYGGSENTISFGEGQEKKTLVFSSTAGNNYNIVATDSVNDIEIQGGNGHAIACGAYADKITVNNATGKDYIINTGDGDDYVYIKAGHVKLLEMGEGNQTLVLENGIVDSINSRGDITTVIRGGVIYIDENTKKLPILEDGNNTVYFSNVNLKEFKGGLGNDTFVLNSGYVGVLMGDKGSDTYILNHLEKNKEYVINQSLSNGLKPLNDEKDSLVLNNFDSTSFTVDKDENGNVLLINADLNTVIRIEGWQDNALNNVVFRDKEVSGKTIDIATGMGGNGISQVQIIRDFMGVLDHTTTSGNLAFDAAVVACSRGLYSSAQDLIDHFISDCVNYGGTTTTAQKRFLLDYCGINLDNTDTGSISGADAGGPVIKTAASVVEEPAGLTLSDLVYDYTDTVQATDYFGYGTKEYTCAKVNCNGEDITFYWDESKVQSLVDRGLIATRAQLDNMIAGVIEAWSGASFNLISESYGMSLAEEGSNLYTLADGSRAIMLALDYASPSVNSMYLSSLSSSWVAAVSSTSGLGMYINGKYTYGGVREAMLINTYYYQGGFRDISGQPAATSISSQYLDRVISHELVHGTMAANVNGFSSLPSFLKEGLAELVHGVDDVRRYEILSMANTGWSMYYSNGDVKNQEQILKQVFDLKASTNSMSTYTYGGGFALLRYLAKTASDYSKNLSWGDFDYEGYMEELKNFEMSFNEGQSDPGRIEREIYVDPFYEDMYKVTGNL